MTLIALALSLFARQAPGSGWVMAPGPPREVRRLYWDLFQTTEVWVRLTPRDPAGAAPLVSLIFQAFFPGRAPLEAYSLVPQWPKGVPDRLVVRAEPFPLTAVRSLSLRFAIDGFTFDLTGPGARYTIVPCGHECAPTAVEVELAASLLRALTTARTVGGEPLGFPIRLAPDDQRALAEFVGRIGITPAAR